MIEIREETIERVEKILAGVPKGAERALTNAINRGLSRAKTKAFKEVTGVYSVKQGDVSGATRTRVQKANTGSVAGYISFSGARLPLYKFNVSPKMPKKSKHIKAGLMKGSWTLFENAFIAQMNSGHIGIFERETSKRFPIKQIMGLAGAQMVGNEEVIENLEKEAQEVVEKRVEQEIYRLLNEYGG